jgi:hypothetical protein
MIESNDTEARPTTRRAGAAGGLALLVGCAVACSLPVMLSSGAAVGALALLSGGQGIAAAVVAVGAGLTGWLVWRGRRRRVTVAGGSCAWGC